MRILMFHKIARAPWATNLPGLYVSPAEFERQVSALVRAGEQCVPFGEVKAAAESGKQGYCLSFDDGFENVLDNALPVLVRHRLRAIQFLVAGLIGQEDQWDRAIGEPPLRLMNEAQVRDWLAAGQDIGSHTMWHPHLTALAPERARAEIFDSRKALEDQFQTPIRHFCYPYGDCNERVRDWVGEAGYEAACTTVEAVNGPGVDPLRLHRFMAVEERGFLAGLPGRIARAWRLRNTR
jgi:peptidoglycan/xylan/chitin deacetylase (PgdA/CDA1 family)